MKKSGVVIIVILLVVIGVLAAVFPFLLFFAVPFAFVFIFSMLKDARAGGVQDRAASPAGSSLSDVVSNELRIVDESLHLVNTSGNLETVLNRYDDLVAALHRLSAYEGDPSVSFPHELPSAVLVRLEGEKPEIINRAIQRAYDSMLKKCAALKTEKGRKNRQLAFFDEINGLMPRFPAPSRDFAVTFINENINDPLTGLEGL